MNYTVRSSLRELYDIYSQNRVHRYAAAFSYYVTLSIFPFIIIVSIMIAPLHVDLIELADVIGRVVPDSVIEILLNHLQYVSNNNSGLILWSAIVVLCTTASGAFRVLMDIMKDIHGESRFSGFFGFIFSFVLAIGVLVFIYITSLLMVTGGWVMNLLEVHFGFSILTSIWMWLRYLLLFPLAFIFLQFVYSITLPKGKHKHSRTIGAIVATVFIVIVSIVFSAIMSMTNRYTLIYGSLASVAIMMIWLYFCGIVIIMGNALNVIIERHRTEKEALKNKYKTQK